MQRSVTKAIIPVAGLGTRFLPATKAQPKEMLPLVDKPVIQYVVEEAVQAGIQSIVLVTGRGKQAIENHFDVAYELEQTLEKNFRTADLELVRAISRLAQFAYVRQGEPLGLGHAVLCARSMACEEPVAVLLGDDVFDGDIPALTPLLQAYARTGKSVVGVQEVPLERVSSYGIVSGPESDSAVWDVREIVEKPSPECAPSRFAIVGRYILTPETFDILQDLPAGHGGEIQLTDALAILARQGRLMAAHIPCRHFDTGNKLEYIKACIEYALQRPELREPLGEYLCQRVAQLGTPT